LSLLKVLCSIFQSPILAQYLDKICDAVHSLHEKRKDQQQPKAAEPKATTSPLSNVPPVMKSQRIKALVKLILKKLMKKFSYELIHEKIFSAEKKATSSSEAAATECGRQRQALSSAMQQGLENLLTNLKKLIEKERKKKLEGDAAKEAGNKGQKAGNLDLVSVYTSNDKHSNATYGFNNE
jgi:hypothetical protein